MSISTYWASEHQHILSIRASAHTEHQSISILSNTKHHDKQGNTEHKASLFQKMRLLTNSNNINTLKLLIAGDLAGQKLEVSYVPPGREARYTPRIFMHPFNPAAVNCILANLQGGLFNWSPLNFSSTKSNVNSSSVRRYTWILYLNNLGGLQ